MISSSKKTEELVSKMRGYLQDKINKSDYTSEEPLRAELFTSYQMEQHGKTLAGIHKLSAKRGQDQLLGRLADNEKVLLEVRAMVPETINASYQMTPAGEWLIDNFYLIEEQIRTAKRHLPKGYSENLPQLANGPSAGLSRVYDIALQIISHSDGRIDVESLSGFVKAYQTIIQLQLGELWAIPIMLRLALIENLRRVSAMIAIDRIDRDLADYWAQRMIETAEKESGNLITTIADMTRSNPPLVSAFVAEMNRQLSGKGPGLALALSWMEQRISENGTTSIELIVAENQKQAANQLSMRNSIDSLRILSVMDWRDFVENHSIVEHILREDPSGTYAGMDFSTRDRYRHVVEYLAKKSKLPEEEIAHIAINLAQQTNTNKSERSSHVGYYLVGNGLPETSKQASIPKSIGTVFHDFISQQTFFIYFTSILLITVATTGAIYKAIRAEQTSIPLLILVVVLSFIGASQFAITLVNFISTLLVNPRMLARMDFSKGIPPESHTLVVVPAMLTNLTDIDNLVEALEVRYLANRDENLQFGLLTDFMDALTEKTPDDEALESCVRQGVEALNKKYEKTENELFFLFHRPRRWNSADKIWMGYERKRGKLAELNALLRGNGRDKFSTTVGNLSSLLQVKYVITLDADTQLPRGTAWKLAATMAHPLNRAFYSEKKQRVTEGYGILQPRITVSLPELTASHYAKLHGNEPGIDPYTRATSDVYQDLFAEGSFIGKGIYEVDIFEKVLNGKFPENRILSHDLLEGCYIRSGLLSDVQLYEKYPSTYATDVKRRARWIRGDWQIAAWASPFVPSADGCWKGNPLSPLSRWKIFDNIRRSLVPIALTLFIVLGWTVLVNHLFWTLAVSGLIVLPIIIAFIWDVCRKPKEVILTQHLILSGLNGGGIFIKTVFSLICLPHEACYSLVSIIRTSWRILFSHKKLLEWNPFATEENMRIKGFIGSYIFMWPELLLAVTTFAYLFVKFPVRLSSAGPILVFWVVAPFITWFISRPLSKQANTLSNLQLMFLRALARKTWGFFDRFVVQQDNWIPPDNFQEHPTPMIAHRTSPTNIGLYLLANLSACDFGYISIAQFLERTQQTLATISKLEKYRGHLYNWYDTRTLEPLLPKYVSTVDSGNLAGHLLTLRQGLIETPSQKIIGPRLFEGLRDTLQVIIEDRKQRDIEPMAGFKIALDKACLNPPATPNEARCYLEELSALYSTAASLLLHNAPSFALWWQQMMTEQLDEALENIKILEPWYLLAAPPAKFIKLVVVIQNLP
jgi:cyclic beta-1,2-glucan synthetase